MFVCLLCEKESLLLHRFCDSCQVVKRIMNVYGSEECREILERVCIRDNEQRLRKINLEKKTKLYGEKQAQSK